MTIQHNVRAQKISTTNRYEVDHSAQFHLGEELRKGHVKIDKWLKQNTLPRLPLPTVCGYIPSVRYIASNVIDDNIEHEEHVVMKQQQRSESAAFAF